jgi:hypothetical protein
VKAKRSAATGSVVDAKARIVFDTEEPIDTPPIFNTLDAAKPTSAVNALPATAEETEFTVAWGGEDDGSAIAGFSTFVSKDGGDYLPWLWQTNRTEAVYTAESGHVYAFYAVATDYVGNIEAAPSVADTQILVGAALGRIEGIKYEDVDGDGFKGAGEPGLGGRTIFLDADEDGVLDDVEVSTITADDGSFSFADLDPGSYRVVESVLDGWVQTAPAEGYYEVTIASGEIVTGVDFGNFELTELSGIVFDDLDGSGSQDSGELGIGGVTVYLDLDENGSLDASETSVTTLGDGSYVFSGMEPGTYQVRSLAPTGMTLTAPGSSYHAVAMVSGQPQTGNDFGYQGTAPATGSINGYKFEDLDGNGAWDEGEPGLEGWSIFLDANANGLLDDDEQTAVTDSEKEEEREETKRS